MRIYGELAQLLDRDAIVIGDGGDFVSYAGRVVDSYEPGAGSIPGRSAASAPGPVTRSRRSSPIRDRQVVLLLGDGAFGFSGMEFDTLARHGVAVVGGDGQQRHLGAREAPDGVPLRLLGRGRPDAPRPATTRSSRRSAGHGELVREPVQLRPALERALASRRPALVNVLTDPSVAYPTPVEPGLAGPAGLTKTARIFSGRLPIQVWPNRDGQGYVPERAG